MTPTPYVSALARALRAFQQEWLLDAVSASLRDDEHARLLTLRWHGDDVSIETDDGDTQVLDAGMLL